jgi:hypothetical protein
MKLFTESKDVQGENRGTKSLPAADRQISKHFSILDMDLI